jgi:aldose 1-epimerase
VSVELIAVAADRFTPVNDSLIPTGAIQSVQGTDYDFRTLDELGGRLRAAHDPLVVARHGFDVNLVLAGRARALNYAATLQDPRTGIELQVYTTEPALQLYTPNFPAHEITGKAGMLYAGAAAVCLESQHFPDSPHHPQFPSTVLHAGRVFHSESVYRFSVSKGSEAAH